MSETPDGVVDSRSDWAWGRTSPPPAGSLRGVALGLAVLVAVACTDLLGPSQLERVNPQLQALSFDDLGTTLRDGGILYVYGSPADPSFSLESNQRVPVEVTVTSGDRESVGLYRVVCPPNRRRDGGFHCFRFVLAMQPGHDATEVAGYVASIGGRFDLLGEGWAVVTLFSPDDLVKRARRAGSWPGVAFSELSWPWCSVPSCPSLLSPVPVDTGGAAPGDGVLQVRSGDTVVVAYRQPAGGGLELRLPVP